MKSFCSSRKPMVVMSIYDIFELSCQEQNMSFEAGTKSVGNIPLRKELGEGGIAIVYKVVTSASKISRALKVLKISHPN